jgi:putative transcriptional regulator
MSPDKVDIKALRATLGLSQKEFAQKFRFNERTLQEWEQGRAEPTSSAKFMLQAIRQAPSLIARTLEEIDAAERRKPRSA